MDDEFYYPDEIDDIELSQFCENVVNVNEKENETDEDDKMINNFLQAQKSKNTDYKTRSDMNAWKRFWQSNKETRNMEAIPAEELSKMLCKFFISVRKQDGGEYEPVSLTGFQRRFQRYLEEKGAKFNILKDKEFAKSRNVLAAKRKNLTLQGKGNRPNAARELTKAEENKLFESGQMSYDNPKSLQRSLWWCMSMQFGWRARDESRKLSWGDINLETDPETGDECLVWRKERGSKTRTGQEGGHRRAFEPRAYASSNKLRCPVEFYKAFKSHRPDAMLKPESPFYLAINYKRKPEEKCWYLSRPLGKNEIGKFLKESAQEAGLFDAENRHGRCERKITNHSVRKTCIGRLLDANVEANFVAQLSGHKNLKSLDSYKSASLKHQRSMSSILSETTSSSSNTASTNASLQVPSSSTVVNQSAEINSSSSLEIPQSIFAGARFESCSFALNIFTSQSKEGQ